MLCFLYFFQYIMKWNLYCLTIKTYYWFYSFVQHFIDSFLTNNIPGIEIISIPLPENNILFDLQIQLHYNFDQFFASFTFINFVTAIPSLVCLLYLVITSLCWRNTNYILIFQMRMNPLSWRKAFCLHLLVFLELIGKFLVKDSNATKCVWSLTTINGWDLNRVANYGTYSCLLHPQPLHFRINNDDGQCQPRPKLPS